MGVLTSAMIKFHWKSRLSPKLMDNNFSPYELIFDPLTAVKYSVLLRRLSLSEAGKTLTAAPVSTRKFFLEFLSRTKSNRESCFVAGEPVFLQLAILGSHRKYTV